MTTQSRFSLLFLGSKKVIIDHIAGDAYVTSSLVRHGLIPCAPFSPVVAFTVRTLEFYRVSHNRCPHISIHSFVKTLCDLYCSPFKPHLSRQFSISYDLYLEIRRVTNDRVQAALARNTADYRLRHACPACTYCLEDEPKLKFSMLYTVDGNDSLKRIVRGDAPPIDLTADAEPSTVPILPTPSEVLDLRIAGHAIYLTNEQVDKWSKETLGTICPSYSEQEEDGNPCAERWKNMRTELTAKMWGVFEESGLFLALCRHGFVLMLADMVRSGELYASGLLHSSTQSYHLPGQNIPLQLWQRCWTSLGLISPLGMILVAGSVQPSTTVP